MIRTELEWLGFELALRRRFLLSPKCAAILTEIARRPKAVPAARLVAVAEIADASVAPLVSHLREHLDDMGFRAKIRFSRTDGGYRLSPGAADELWARVLEDLALAA